MRNKIELSILLVVTLVLMLLTASQTFVYASSLEHEYHENLIEQRQEETTKEIKALYEEDHKPKEKKRPKSIETSPWKSIGMCRITTYCPWCNDPPGTYESSSGSQLYEGCAACNWLAIGTKIRINGNEYTVVDICGTDAIDIFVDTSSCCCHTNYYTNVEIYK